jgi:hypothetical protein
LFELAWLFVFVVSSSSLIFALYQYSIFFFFFSLDSRSILREIDGKRQKEKNVENKNIENRNYTNVES